MAHYKVTKVRKDSPPLNPTHKHIVGVLTEDGAYHTVQEVVDSLAQGDTWATSVEGEPEVEILAQPFCPKQWCMHAPYLATGSGETPLAADIEKLPPG